MLCQQTVADNFRGIRTEGYLRDSIVIISCNNGERSGVGNCRYKAGEFCAAVIILIQKYNVSAER